MNQALMVQQRKRRQEMQKTGNNSGGYQQLSSVFQSADTEPENEELEKVLEEDEKDAKLRDWFKRTSGLHTVEQWATNYLNHPAGWGALLMIHGVPEITGRLRNKVENFAVYSALFLASAVAALIAPPDKIVSCTEGLGCAIRNRVFFYSLIIGVAAQILCIMLAMAFGNALNEAARDADVFRMFSPAGNAFFATRKCELAYLTGLAATFVGMLAAVQAYMGWEMIIFSAVVVGGALKIYTDTASALFKSAGIVDYWKSGNHGPDDPYDLTFPVHLFQDQVRGMQSVAAMVTPRGRAAAVETGEQSRSFAYSSRDCSQPPKGRSCMGMV
eukprot:TRINITY_DN6593_c0_g2_i1.p1 TRINITY_DN6593_c0_g2~~TRINITY_DN6593_c0_g2_i1.p1  ORF type:complete len:329 (-),score=37.88 TRINITY_DN6593_c0_g2_i1:436-1422(-)